MKSFSQYLQEKKLESKSVVFTFGRFNPPTIGHEKLVDKVASVAKGSNYRIYASQSSDKKKNPLSYEQKIKFMRQMFPKHGRNIILSKTVKTALQVMTELYDQGFTEVTMVVGSDRVDEFSSLLEKYNGKDLNHGFYNFEKINVVSAGERDPDAEGVTGMSASKMRAAAAENDFGLFSKGLPTGFSGAKELFNAVRKGMGLSESNDFRKHIQLEPISEIREKYVSGELYTVGDLVTIKESDETAEVLKCGANYVLVEYSDGTRKRKWLDDVELIEEMSQSTKDKRAAHFSKNSKKDDDDPSAYKPAPGDASAETKPSKYTKKYKDLYGEQYSSFRTIITEKVETALKAKADKSGISVGILRKVYNRGVAAWKGSHRPGTTPSQWGMARVNSFIVGGKTRTTADADLWKKHKGE